MRALATLGAALLIATAAWAGEDAPRITVTGHGEATAVPDIATLSAGVETRGPNAEAALAANSEAMARVVAAVKAAGIAPRAIRTEGLSVTPVPERDTDGRSLTGRIDHYRVSNTVAIRTRDLDRLGGLIDRLVRAGANSLGQVSFALSDPGAAMVEARRAAMEDARAAAEAYADAAGLDLGPVLSISEGGGGGGPYPAPRAMRLDAAMEAPIERGETTVAASVTVVWVLGEAD